MNTDELVTSGFLIPPVSFRNNKKKFWPTHLLFYVLTDPRSQHHMNISVFSKHPASAPAHPTTPLCVWSFRGLSKCRLWGAIKSENPSDPIDLKWAREFAFLTSSQAMMLVLGTTFRDPLLYTNHNKIHYTFRDAIKEWWIVFNWT